MNDHTTIFDTQWLEQAALQNENTWAIDVQEDLERTGRTYLRNVADWYHTFMAEFDKEQHLLRSLKSFDNSRHVEAVHELALYSYLYRNGMTVNPVTRRKEQRTPDFHVIGSFEYYMEITSLNPSDKDKQSSVAELDQNENIKRILGKIIYKAPQLDIAASQEIPGLLVVFDYTTWSGLGAQTSTALSNILSNTDGAYFSWPRNISALAFIHRDVIRGIPRINQERSVVLHNPLALYEINESMFSDLTHHRHGVVEEANVVV